MSTLDQADLDAILALFTTYGAAKESTLLETQDAASAAAFAAVARNFLGVNGWKSSPAMTVTFSGSIPPGSFINFVAAVWGGITGNLPAVVYPSQSTEYQLGVLSNTGFTPDAGWSGEIYADCVELQVDVTGGAVTAGTLTITVQDRMGNTKVFPVVFPGSDITLNNLLIGADGRLWRNAEAQWVPLDISPSLSQIADAVWDKNFLGGHSAGTTLNDIGAVLWSQVLVGASMFDSVMFNGSLNGDAYITISGGSGPGSSIMVPVNTVTEIGTLSSSGWTLTGSWGADYLYIEIAGGTGSGIDAGDLVFYSGGVEMFRFPVSGTPPDRTQFGYVGKNGELYYDNNDSLISVKTPTIATKIADIVWDESAAGHSATGSYGNILNRTDKINKSHVQSLVSGINSIEFLVGSYTDIPNNLEFRSSIDPINWDESNPNFGYLDVSTGAWVNNANPGGFLSVSYSPAVPMTTDVLMKVVLSDTLNIIGYFYLVLPKGYRGEDLLVATDGALTDYGTARWGPPAPDVLTQNTGSGLAAIKAKTDLMKRPWQDVPLLGVADVVGASWSGSPLGSCVITVLGGLFDGSDPDTGLGIAGYLDASGWTKDQNLGWAGGILLSIAGGNIPSDGTLTLTFDVAGGNGQSAIDIPLKSGFSTPSPSPIRADGVLLIQVRDAWTPVFATPTQSGATPAQIADAVWDANFDKWNINSPSMPVVGVGDSTDNMGKLLVHGTHQLTRTIGLAAESLISVASFSPEIPTVTVLSGSVNAGFILKVIATNGQNLADEKLMGTWDITNGFQLDAGWNDLLEDSRIFYLTWDIDPSPPMSEPLVLRWVWTSHGGQTFDTILPVGVVCCFFNKDGSSVYWGGGTMKSTYSAPAQIADATLSKLDATAFAEPAQGSPPSSASFIQKIGYLYKAWRNKSTQTSSQYSLYNDNSVTVDQKASFSDDGTTAARGKINGGP